MSDATAGRVLRGIVSAPLTYAWLLALFVTTRIQRSAGRRGALELQREHSTNLDRLRTEPLRVLLTSLFWLDGRQWWPYVPAFIAVVAPAEKRLRWWRWLLVGIAAHVIGTYLGQGYLKRHIDKGSAPKRLVKTRDVGVSYFVFGVAGALTGYLRRPWKIRSQAAGVGALAAVTAIQPDHTQVGHLTAFVVGLAAIPFAPDRDRLTLSLTPPRD